MSEYNKTERLKTLESYKKILKLVERLGDLNLAQLRQQEKINYCAGVAINELYEKVKTLEDKIERLEFGKSLGK